MLEAILILFIVIWAFLYFKVRDIFSPWSITLIVWVAIIAGYLYIDHGLYEVTDQFPKAILLWCVTFCVVGYIIFRLTPSYNGFEWSVNHTVVKTFTLLAILITPFALYKAVAFALSAGSGNLLNTMRLQVIDKDSGFSLGPIAYFIHIIYAILFVSADASTNFNKRFFFTCIIINFLFFFVMMSKLILFIGLLSTLYLSYVHHRIHLRNIIVFCAIFGVVGLFFTQLRTSADGDADNTYTIMELFGMYLISPIVAFCAEAGNTSPVWGYETFRPVYHILESLGLSNAPAFDGSRFFINVPIPTNVYTMMAPIFNDFGYFGIAICAGIESAFIAWVYKKAYTGHTIARNIYAYLVAIIALQFFDEQFFAGLSNLLQMAIWIIVCHTTVTWEPKSKQLFSIKNHL